MKNNKTQSRSALKKSAHKKTAAALSARKNERLISLTKSAVILLAAGLFFLTAGILAGDNAVIFRKAVFICMECIGLG